MKPCSRLVATVALAVICGPASPAMTQEPLPAHELEGVSITATRIERKTAEVPASVTVVGEEVIEETQMFNIKEVLRGSPGVLIDSPNQGYDSRLIIRGAGLKARYGVRDIMVLLDGVPITDPDSLTPIYLRRPEAVEKWEQRHGITGPSAQGCGKRHKSI